MVDTRRAAQELVKEYRDRCLWFLREDYLPQTPQEIRNALELIERYGDRTAFRRAREIREWL